MGFNTGCAERAGNPARVMPTGPVGITRFAPTYRQSAGLITPTPPRFRT